MNLYMSYVQGACIEEISQLHLLSVTCIAVAMSSRRSTLKILCFRVDKKDIRLLEASLTRWQVLVQSLSGTSVELDKNTLAVLRGRLVRFLMRSREVGYVDLFVSNCICTVLGLSGSGTLAVWA